MDELPTLLQSIREDPHDRARWVALSFWLWANGREDEAAVVRVFWPMLREHMTEDGRSLEETLADVADKATPLGAAAREVEAQAKQSDAS